MENRILLWGFLQVQKYIFHIFGTTKKCVFCTFLKKESRKAIFFTTKNGLFLWILTHGEIPSWGCGGWVLCGGGNRSREGRGLTPRSRTLSLKNRRLTCTYQPNCICGMNSPNLGELSSPLFFFLEAIPPASYISGKLEFFPWHEMKFSLIIILQFFFKKNIFWWYREMNKRNKSSSIKIVLAILETLWKPYFTIYSYCQTGFFQIQWKRRSILVAFPFYLKIIEFYTESYLFGITK